MARERRRTGRSCLLRVSPRRCGIVFTNGDPSGLTRNTVAGTDFQYLDSNFTPGKVLATDIYYERSFSNKKGDDDALGVTINYPNEPWGGVFHFKELGPNYFPALGFVNRTGIKTYDGNFQRRDRNIAGLRFVELLTRWNIVTALDNHIESRENILENRINTRIADEFRVRVINDFEDVPAVFKIASKVPVPVGRYNWTNVGAEMRSSDARPYLAMLDVTCCSFYNGRSLVVDLHVDYRPNALFQFGPHYTYTSISLPTGPVDIHLIAADFIVNFTPDMQLFTQGQFDNISQKFALSLRYRWEYQPGNEIFASIGQSALIPGTTFTPQISQAVIRLGHTFRY